MALLKVAKLGDPVLRQDTKLVNLKDLNSPDGKLQLLIDNMIDTMRLEDGVGLAAPQVFESLRLVVVECSFNDRYSEAPNIPLTVLVNPSIKDYSVETVLGLGGLPESKRFTWTGPSLYKNNGRLF